MALAKAVADNLPFIATVWHLQTVDISLQRLSHGYRCSHRPSNWRSIRLLQECWNALVSISAPFPDQN